MENIVQFVYKVITGQGTGSAFKVNGYDFIITNYHVVDGNREVAVEDYKKDRHLAKIIMVNPDADIAFLSIETLRGNTEGIALDENISVATLQKVYINGFPFGLPYTVTEGIVSSPNQPMENRMYIQTDAAVNPGNSGGPMLNAAGILIGITTSKFNNADNVGFGIRHSDLIKELKDFVGQEYVYNVKCNSCDSYLTEVSEFCNNCGNNINKSVFETFEKSYFAKFVEETLSEFGLNPLLGRAGYEFWEFHQGSALVRIFVYKKNYLVATSPLNKLPKKNLVELLSYLLSDSVEPYMLGVSENQIYISYRVHISDIFSDKVNEIKENIKNLVLKADELDDFFVANYECEKSIEAK